MNKGKKKISNFLELRVKSCLKHVKTKQVQTCVKS